MNSFQSLRFMLILLAASLATGSTLAQTAGSSSGYTASTESPDWESTVSTLPWQHVVIFQKRN
jgi:hypothetical protein